MKDEMKPDYPFTLDELIILIEDKIEFGKNDEWEWTGFLNGKPGVPTVMIDGTFYNIRRALYELYHETVLGPKTRLYSVDGTRLNVNPEQNTAVRTTFSIFDICTPKQLARVKVRLRNVYEEDKENGCWVIQRKGFKSGYGSFHVAGKTLYTHRVSWEIHNDKPIPDGLYVMHTCDNPKCINPDHLKLGTQKDNISDMIKKGRHNVRRGDEKVSSKLTKEQVKEILGMYYHEGEKTKDIAVKFGITCGHVSSIAKRRLWKWVWDEMEEEGILDKSMI